MAGVDLALRVCAVLAVGWVAAVCLRKASASLRASVWTVTLAGVLVLPLVSALVPSWRIPVLAPSQAIEITSSASSTLVTSSSSSKEVPSLTYIAADEIPWTVIARPIWALGTLLLLIRIVASHAKLARVARRASKCEDTSALPLHMVDLSGVRIRFTDEVAVPAIAGLISPVLLLPPDAGSWTPELWRGVIRHELAHVRRRDPIGRLIGQLVCALYWFVPLAWIGASRADALREHACDDEVLRSGVPASVYATSLIELAQQAGCAAIEPAALAMAASSSIQERVMMILNPSVARRAVTIRASLVLMFAAAGAVTLAAAVMPVERPAPPRPAVHAAAQVTTVAQTTATPQTTTVTQTSSATKTTAAPQATTVTRTTEAPKTIVSGSSLCNGEITSTSRSMSGSATATSSSSSSSASSSSSDNNGKRVWNVVLRGPECSADLKVEGNVVFGSDFSVTSLSPDGFLSLDVTEKSVRRQLDVKSDRGSLVYTWRVDGREQPYDAAARAWFSKVMTDLGTHKVMIK